jgi:hypothetical protein
MLFALSVVNFTKSPNPFGVSDMPRHIDSSRRSRAIVGTAAQAPIPIWAMAANNDTLSS